MTRKRLLLVGWDSADWKIIRPLAAEGKLPAFSRLMEGGVTGNLTTLEPQLSPMLWTAIATGKHAYHHGVPGFTEVDAGGRVVPVSAATRTCRALWEMLGGHGLKSHLVSWFATQGGTMPTGGCMVSNLYNSFPHAEEDAPEDWPTPAAGTYFPPELEEHLNPLRVSPWDMDGDEVMRLLVPEAHLVDQSQDRRLWSLATRLAEAFSVHAASCWLLENRPDWDFMGIYYRAIDEICHEFMCYHPPQLPGVSDADFALYQHVVAGAYRLHDLMLARLMELAGPEAAVMLVSDHGFHSDHLRPEHTPAVPAGITVWHRLQGVIAAAGPGFKQKESVYGARLLDIVPTILTYFGLPTGADMEGRALLEAFSEKQVMRTIPTWEDPALALPAAVALLPLSDADNDALLDQFVALGYINAVSSDPTEAAAETRRENLWNMARACMDGSRYEQALPLLEEIHHHTPGRTDWAQLLARCQLRLGLLDEAAATASATLTTFDETQAAAAHLIQANIAMERKEAAEALRHLTIAGSHLPRSLAVLALQIEALLRLHQWDACILACRTTLELDPQNALANIGLARCALHQGDADRAVIHALEATGLQYGNPRGHFLLGAALHAQGEHRAAAAALGLATQLAPHFYPAWRYLISSLQAMGHPDAAEGAQIKLRLLRQNRPAQSLRQNVSRLREASAARVPDFIAAGEKHRAKAAAPAAGAATALPADREFVIVSGLPRSGTSLMMQMLRAGGLPAMTDGERVADEDNPEGYWEWEAVKNLPGDALLIEQAHGKATKVISALLPALPVKHRYRIIFMQRPAGEVVASQSKMIARRGTQAGSGEAQMETAQTRHTEEILAVLRNHPRISLLEVDFPSLIANPTTVAASVAAFLGDALPGPGAMAAVVKPALHRQRIPVHLSA